MQEWHPNYSNPFFLFLFFLILLNNKRQKLNYVDFSDLYHILHSVAAFVLKCVYIALSLSLSVSEWKCVCMCVCGPFNWKVKKSQLSLSGTTALQKDCRVDYRLHYEL